ncbi:hypothetical protein F3Y22_tig00111976pilonHSYRG00030 [Hibiscus syriacus]|uniref:Uncharacterized protein n=1 Tax=Hibiscus syriacus TaxID=106335 RepID=A0A6A2X7U4_HIBSY|nr:hypothetical protein F3Y22_tig00111976pilonHSYRG00030 [Hibiscus syriacus]
MVDQENGVKGVHNNNGLENEKGLLAASKKSGDYPSNRSEEQAKRRSRITQEDIDENLVRKLEKCLVGMTVMACSSRMWKIGYAKESIDEVVDLEAGRDIFKAGRSKVSSEEKITESWLEEGEVQLCCMGNISGGDYLSGEDKVERNISEEAIMGLGNNDEETGNVQKRREDTVGPEEREALDDRRKFTWFGPRNRRSHLDIIFVEDDWFQENSDATMWGLPRSVSDHIPILLVKEMIDWDPIPFKLINSWLHQERCTDVIKDTLELEVSRDEDLSAKLRRVKGALQKME